MKEELSDILTYAHNSLMSGVHTCLPGQIETYNPLMKKATVKPLVKRKLTDGTYLPLPVITDVPVCFPGTNTSLIHFPLKRLDGCILLFSERSMTEFLTLGGDSSPSDIRRFSLTDAMCIPGLFPFVSPGKLPTGNTFEISYNASSIKIDEKTGIVTINGNLDVLL